MIIFEIIDNKVVKMKAYYSDLLEAYVTRYRGRLFYFSDPSISCKELLEKLMKTKETTLDKIKYYKHSLKSLNEQIKICKLSCRSRTLKRRSRA